MVWSFLNKPFQAHAQPRFQKGGYIDVLYRGLGPCSPRRFDVLKLSFWERSSSGLILLKPPCSRGLLKTPLTSKRFYAKKATAVPLSLVVAMHHVFIADQRLNAESACEHLRKEVWEYFRERKLSQIAHFSHTKGCHALKFCFRESFLPRKFSTIWYICN